MNNQNIKIYIGISLALIILLILVLVIPFVKKPATSNQQPVTSFPTPTTFQANSTGSTNSIIVTPTVITIKAGSTGGINDPLPQPILNLANQKKDLRQKTPFNLGAFSIDFDYNQDKFVVTLTSPKDSSQKAFESWRTSNYPSLGSDQFLLK